MYVGLSPGLDVTSEEAVCAVEECSESVSNEDNGGEWGGEEGGGVVAAEEEGSGANAEIAAVCVPGGECGGD